MKASYLGAMGYAHRRDFPPTWPTPPSYSDPETSVQSYQDGMEECEFAELVATRSDDAVRYAAEHHLGLGVSFIPVDDTGRITDKYHA